MSEPRFASSGGSFVNLLLKSESCWRRPRRPACRLSSDSSLPESESRLSESSDAESRTKGGSSRRSADPRSRTPEIEADATCPSQRPALVPPSGLDGGIEVDASSRPEWSSSRDICSPPEMA